MVAVFTARKPLEQIAFEKSAGLDAFPDQHLYPDAQFKGTVLYEGRVRVTMPAPGGQVSFELLDGFYSSGPIVATDEIFIETHDLAIAGAWTVGTVTDPSAEVDPLDPPASIEIVQVDPENTSGSHSTQVPNRTRGRIDTTVDARISAAVTLLNANLRARGTLGFSRSSDNMRQLTFQGTVSGTWIIGSIVTGGTSGAVGTVVGLGPGINQGLGPDAFGFFITVDMGVDYAGAEFDDATPEVVTASNGASGTLKLGDIGERSTGVLFRPQGNPAYISGAGIKLFATSGGLDFVFSGNGIKFPNSQIPTANGIYLGDVVQFDDAPIAGQVFAVVDIVSGPGDPPTFRNVIITDPPHGQPDGPTSQSPIDIFYDPTVPEQLLALAVEIEDPGSSQVRITPADGRTWSGIGAQLGDNLRWKNSVGGTNNGDIRVANFFTTTNPDDKVVLPGDLGPAFPNLPLPDMIDVYKLIK